ncbi:hypothetical protein AMCSP13_000224 [Streptococcus pneumoniae 2070335]|nr:hypothetical protein AMCSP13_000224 [Streptococcus pneumoniae 2070335]
MQLYKHQGWEQFPVLFYFNFKKKEERNEKIVLVSLAFLLSWLVADRKRNWTSYKNRKGYASVGIASY